MRDASIIPECVNCGQEAGQACDFCGEPVCDDCERDGYCRWCVKEENE